MTLITVTDMMGQQVKIGDKIAKSHKSKYSTNELLVGVVVDIRRHRLNMRTGKKRYGSTFVNPLEDVLLVRWENSSDHVAALLYWDKSMSERKAKGKPPPPVGWDHPYPNYREKTTPLYVKHKAFIKIG